MATFAEPSASVERWLVEYQASTGTWLADYSGPHVSYDDRDTALDWAVRLRSIHDHVRLRREVVSFETVT